jgi:hypothetical protein
MSELQRVVENLAVTDSLTVVFHAEKDGKIRVASVQWPSKGSFSLKTQWHVLLGQHYSRRQGGLPRDAKERRSEGFLGQRIDVAVLQGIAAPKRQGRSKA